MRGILWTAILGAALALAGCRTGSPNASPTLSEAPASVSGFPVTVTDASRRKVQIPRLPERIVSLAPAHTETLYALGLGEKVVAADTYSDYPETVKAKATLNCWPRPPTEQIVALKPDLVVLFTQGDDFLREMDAVGIPTVKLFATSYAETLQDIRTLGRITGTTATAEEMVRTMETRLAAVEKRVAGAPPRTVMLELDAVDPARPFVAGGKGVYGDLLERAGGKNLFADLPQPAVQVSAEQVLDRNPEVILLGDTKAPVQPQQPEAVRSRPGWAQIRAVRNGEVYRVYSERITRPGLRLVEGLEEIARLLHPDRFPEPAAVAGSNE